MTNRQNTFLLKRSNVSGKIPLPGDIKLGEVALNTADVILYASGTTTNEILPIGWDRISRTGDTVTGNFLINGGLTATTITVTGNTSLQSLTATTTNINGNLTVTGNTILQDLTATTVSATTVLTNTIGASGNCVNDIYVSNIHSCSPLNINPLDEGNVYFGSTSGVTVDVSNNRLGINTSNPQYRLDILDTNSRFYYDPSSAGGVVVVSGKTNVPRIGMLIPSYLTKPVASVSMGLRAWDDTLYGGYGKVGDMFIRSSSESNGLNLISAAGSGTEDYIRFYAGQDATGIADLHINGTGATKGFVGIGTQTPSSLLDVNGKTKTITLQVTSNTDINGKLTVTGDTNLQALTATTINVPSLADNKIIYTTNSGRLSAESNFSYNPNTNTFGVNNINANGNINITGNTNQIGNLTLNGNASVNNLSAITLTFNTTYTGSTPYGVMAWNPTFGVPQVGMLGGNVTQKIGESVYAYIRNAESTTLNKGEVVYIFGASGDKMTVKRASATGDTTSSKTLGVVAESIAPNQLGYVITQGTLDGLSLGSYNPGDIVWLSRVSGQFTKIKQYAPTHLVFIGVVQRANNGNGQLYVKPQNGYEMEEIHDVIATGATYGDLLVYSAFSGYNVWVSSKVLKGNYTISGNTSFNGNICMSNVNGSPTGTNCLDTTLIPSGTTVIHQFQGESGILSHLDDLATGEPNTRGYTFFENNLTNTSFVAVGTGVYTPVIGAPQTFFPYLNLFNVTTGATPATIHLMTYDYSAATGTSTASYLKFTVSLTVQNAQNQSLTFQVRRKRGVVFTFLPIGMSVTPQSNTLQGVTFNGISDALENDEFQVVVKNDTGSNPANSIRVVDFSFSMFT